MVRSLLAAEELHKMFRKIGGLLLLLFSFHASSANDIYLDGIGVEPNSQEQATKQVLLMVFAHASMPIGNIDSCRSFFPQGSKRATLGNYVATQISYYSEAGDNLLSGHCSPKDSGKKCNIDFSHSVPNTEIVSSYGLKFFINDKGKIDRRTLECTGAG